MLNNFEMIYYRGYLRSCNYSCNYCPFCKNKITNIELEKDKMYLLKFIEVLKNKKTSTKLFIAPYGEALIHEYYLENIVKLSTNDKIKEICIQTNGSFDLKKLLSIINIQKGNKEKIKFWISYHPSQIKLEDFYKKCANIYDGGFKFSVGAVSESDQIYNLLELKKKLPNDIYMWINKKEGIKNTEKYTKTEIQCFKNIDPDFDFELKAIKSDFENCNASKKNVFINYKGDIFPCNINKNSFGNLYTGIITEAVCKMKYCSCYLAYSNRTDILLKCKRY